MIFKDFSQYLHYLQSNQFNTTGRFKTRWIKKMEWQVIGNLNFFHVSLTYLILNLNVRYKQEQDNHFQHL